MIELKPCPFCGVVPDEEVNPFLIDHLWIIECDNEGCEIIIEVKDYDKDKVVSEWNNRADGWVPCSERLPNAVAGVLVVFDGVVHKGFLTPEKKWHIFGITESGRPVRSVTHWRSLPEAPK